MSVLIRRFDWQLIVAICILGVASFLALSSINPELAIRQIVWYLLGFIVMFAVAYFDWRPFINEKGFVLGIYIFSISLLALTYFFQPLQGANRWIIAGPLQFQPVELVKVALIIAFAYFFARRHVSMGRFLNILKSFTLLVLPVTLVVFQPDLGSAMILLAIWAGFLLISGIRWRHLVVAIVIAVIAAFFMWNQVLHEYQKERVVGLFFPEYDPLGINYNVIQAKISIGSAGFFGKGFGQGTQLQLGFLPEAEHDFIFAAFTEEWGLAGAFVLLATSLFVMLRIIKIGSTVGGNFFRFVCLGTAVLFLSHFVLNVGSNLGLTPAVGITYPFLSYGGSSILTSFLLIGMIQGIAARLRT
ncbi:hypothetical protein A3A20_02510 [Candidatus Wolfebacteria bacterium RIFCSPLOWO2_01_FULL_45_19]|uniref:Rod shape-determining protein RodA n=1 Tax=Candidatus Wolfebacteria bacterium RIFCSPLOWO2_01_FULL_45_19 TaxID=1802557 RepID=A0A1F8DQ13_9BACT|nr:MAG: Rod shape-determining protein rodA [Parcubacteria group bacterium GW2011_GWB1_45_9]OGM90710.1 MAG: hypothetical protein A3A20_02510 [Candidatus Wolfebacteria bacterium RIFCSPLOWO2_01_FULL_45_19]